MKLVPDSLLGRNALLLIGLIIVGQVFAGLVFRQFVQKPFVTRTAHTLAGDLIAVRAGLSELPEEQRVTFIAGFNRSAIQRRINHEVGPIMRPFERLLIAKTSEALAAQGIEAIWRREDGGVFFLRLHIDGRSDWLSTAGLETSIWVPRAALLSWLAGMVLALIGAFLIQRRINRPLRELVDAVRAIGRGETVPPLSLDGPREIVGVCRSFNQMQMQLAEQERQRALMLGGVSHDLRTPLTKIRLAVELLGEQAERDYTDSIVRSCDRIESIIGQFIDFAGVGSSEQAVRTDVNGLIGDLVVALEVPFRVRLGEISPVILRPQALRRALTNLIENAVRYGQPEYLIATEAEDGHVLIKVRDRGPGIAPDRAAELLQPFTRGSDARDGPAGAGLGLAIAVRIVQLDHGRLELAWPAGGGLEVRVAFPAVRADR